MANTEAKETAESRQDVRHDNYDIDMPDIETGYYFSIYFFRMYFHLWYYCLNLKFDSIL